MRRNKIIYYISFYAMFAAIMSIMAFVPYVGFIEIPPISLTLMHLPVLVFAYIMGWKHGWALGLIFGLLSLLRSLTAKTILDPYFINPLISVLPRVVFGLLAGVVFDLIKKIPARRFRLPIICVSAAVLTLIHTLLVFGTLAVVSFDAINADLSQSGGFFAAFGVLILTSALPEAALAAVLVYPLIYALVPSYNRVFGTKVVR